MEIYESNTSIEVKRTESIRTKEIRTGDQIRVSHYTATCQTVTPKGALFLLDQYLDKAYPMNKANTNKGGYEESDLRTALKSEEVLDIFSDWSDRMVPFENGDLLRIPCFGEIFGSDHDCVGLFEPDGCEQWELMKDKKNRIAFRQDCWEWGWLQNKRKNSATFFCGVAGVGVAFSWGASSVLGVRPAFLIN